MFLLTIRKKFIRELTLIGVVLTALVAGVIICSYQTGIFYGSLQSRYSFICLAYFT